MSQSVPILRISRPADGDEFCSDSNVQGPPRFEISHQDDWLTTEEPLEIRVEGRGIAVIMRTPGHDRELAAGFLISEGLIQSADDLFEITECRATLTPEESGRVVDVLLKDPSILDLEKFTRHVFSSSSCGLCGKATIASLQSQFSPLPTSHESMKGIQPEQLFTLPDQLRNFQHTFDRTGGLHAAGLFNESGIITDVYEDVGRHNAVDKLIGNALLKGGFPLHQHGLMVSGRLSFEIVQKALAAGIPFLAAVSAPSSLAVEFAQSNGQTLVGFLRDRSFNVYAGRHRLATA